MNSNQSSIIVVSGLPRSGTSMMMKMLEAGGVKLLEDNKRCADEDNPKGYFEYEKVKNLQKDSTWLSIARGKAIKIISMLLYHLPPVYRYRIIFMQRAMDEVLASQKRMLARRSKAGRTSLPDSNCDDLSLASKFANHLIRIDQWLSKQPNIEFIYVDYNELLRAPEATIARLCCFLDLESNHEKMSSIIDSSLYRNRHIAEGNSRRP